ncbi:hypothetical protein B2J88_07055 [Rhodococcus sp. SRB_17]|nr:hypothetical protein [Rhodococcus sp. SRB_17]
MMIVSIYVQNMNQKILENVTIVGESALADIISDAPVGSLLNGIRSDMDTMFNSYQLKFLLVELSAVAPKDDEQREMISNLQTAAESVIRRHGYLWFDSAGSGAHEIDLRPFNEAQDVKGAVM